MEKPIHFILVGLLIIIIIGAGFFYWQYDQKKSEAKQVSVESSSKTNSSGAAIVFDKKDGEEESEPREITQVRASHILICYEGATRCTDPTLTKAEALKKIQALKALATPETFGVLAANNSTEPNAKERKGELGWIARGQVVKEFETAVFNYSVGEIFGPVETAFGFHLIYKTGER